jgi:hypothetical protein
VHIPVSEQRENSVGVLRDKGISERFVKVHGDHHFVFDRSV